MHESVYGISHKIRLYHCLSRLNENIDFALSPLCMVFMKVLHLPVIKLNCMCCLCRMSENIPNFLLSLLCIAYAKVLVVSAVELNLCIFFMVWVRTFLILSCIMNDNMRCPPCTWYI